MSSNEISIRPLKCALGLPCVPDVCQAINSTLDLKFEKFKSHLLIKIIDLKNKQPIS